MCIPDPCKTMAITIWTDYCSTSQEFIWVIDFITFFCTYMTSAVIKIHILDDIMDIKKNTASHRLIEKETDFLLCSRIGHSIRIICYRFFPVLSVVLPYIGELRKRNPLKNYVPVSFIIGLQLGKGMVD